MHTDIYWHQTETDSITLNVKVIYRRFHLSLDTHDGKTCSLKFEFDSH